MQDQLLVMLTYFREYGTFFHVGAPFGIGETQCWHTVRRIEGYLVEGKQFHLPGKKTLAGDRIGWDVLVIGVGESPIERPKKTAVELLGQKENAHVENTIGRG